ncbi:hypothetical protein [Paenibacillus dendritiformis]
MVFIGSILIIILLAFGAWLMLTPLFSKIGNKVKNKTSQFREGEKERKLK